MKVKLVRFEFETLDATALGCDASAPIALHIRAGDWAMTGCALLTPKQSRDMAFMFSLAADEAEAAQRVESVE